MTMSEKIYNALMLAFLLMMMVFAAYKIAHGQQSIAYYECDNIPNTFVEFSAPDTIAKRKEIYKSFGCLPLPQIVYNVPFGAKILKQTEKKENENIFNQSFQMKFFMRKK